jgi:hypothetical protein
MKMKQHVTVVGALHIGLGVLGMFAGVVALAAIVGGGVLSGDAEAMLITGIIGPAVGLFLFLLALPSIVGGVGLLKGRSWARILVLILGIFNLVDFPVGTIIGIYTLWVLLNQETALLFDGDAKVVQFATG